MDKEEATKGIKLSKTLLVEGRRGIKYLSQKLFFFERVRDFFDEIFNQSAAMVKNLIKHLIKNLVKDFIYKGTCPILYSTL